MRKKKILLVEHEQDLSVVFNMVLEDGGYEVDCFTESVLALRISRQGSMIWLSLILKGQKWMDLSCTGS
jgi:DNA-binding response OmpR family regulator